MSTLRLHAGTLPVSFCFTTPQALLDAFARYLTVEVPASASEFNFGSSTPAADARGLPWFRLDNTGRPLGWFFFYGGSWRRQYSAALGDIICFNGSKTLFDTTGKGLVDTDCDGWALCNGQNGTPDLQDRFIVAASSQASTVWKSVISGTATASGGEANHKLTMEDVPNLQDNTNGVQNPTQTKIFRQTTGWAPNSNNVKMLANEALPLPPYFALAYKMFIGYT